MKPTKKKKNTYVIKYSVLADLTLFSDCPTTPLPVVSLNGKSVNNGGGWNSCTEFPNPAATDMIRKFDVLKPIMGEKLACTVVEYLDKSTDEPVAILFPTNVLMYREDFGTGFMRHLNHATRQDLKRQMSIRERLLSKLAENQNQK